MRQRQTETDKDKQRQTETDTDRERQRETDKHRQTQTETDRARQRERQRQIETDGDRQRQTETDRMDGSGGLWATDFLLGGTFCLFFGGAKSVCARNIFFCFGWNKFCLPGTKFQFLRNKFICWMCLLGTKIIFALFL